MKKLLSITFLLLLTAFGSSAFAQNSNGNVVVSEVKIYDLGDGTGLIEVRISGNQVSDVSEGVIWITGDILSRAPIVSVPSDVSGNTAMISGVFPLPRTAGDDDFIEATVSLRNRFGNGLDWTYSARSRPRRPSGI